MSKNYLNDAELLEDSRIKLENAQNQPLIAELLAGYGYDENKLNTGRDLLAKAKEAYNFRKQEENETSEAYNKFSGLQITINGKYKKDRKIAKILFEKKPEILNRLGINGNLPKAYVKWFETVNTFYVVSLADIEIQNALSSLKVTIEHLNQQKLDLDQLAHDRAEYLREKGESHQATSSKDKALADLDDWIREFKALAKIALEEHPQLLDALGI